MFDLRKHLLSPRVVRALEDDLLPTSIQSQLNQTALMEGGELVTNFQFRLNGIIITQIKIRPVVIDGITDHWELVACHDTLGEFAIDDNGGLADPALPRFILEVRDVSIPASERRFLPDKGWRQVTTGECLSLLESAGVIDTRTIP